jgi:hypothetical protein
MFHDYSFPPASRHGPSSYNTHTAAIPSPYSYSSTPQAVSSADLNLLTHQFGQQSIRYDPRPANTQYSSNNQYQHTSSSTNYSVQPPQDSYECPHAVSSVRSQRQANTRLQCQPSHTRDISSLVERMVASGETPVADDAPSTQEEDEAIYMGDLEYQQSMAAQTLSYRRSSDFSSSHSYVAKSIRVRKARRQKGDSSQSK